MNGGGGQAPASRSWRPRPAPPPPPGRIRFPTLWPGLLGSTGCSARLSRLGPGGLGREMPPRESPSPGRPTRVPPCAPTGPHPGVSGALGQPPSPNALLRPDVGGCGVVGAVPRGVGGKTSFPFPGAQSSFCGRFYLRKQTKLAAFAFPRSALARVKRSGWLPAGSQPVVGKEPRG